MGDSYRPNRGIQKRQPPLANLTTFGASSGNSDSYRSRQSDFSFRSDRPGPRFPQSGPSNGTSRNLPTRRGRDLPQPRGLQQDGASRRRPQRDNYAGSGRTRGRDHRNSSRRGVFRKQAPHERALLQKHDNGLSEHTLGVSDGPNRFLDLEVLSDDELGFSRDGSGDEGNDQSGSHKVAKTYVQRADSNSVPKWSNPDPYTVLPPPEETTGKKTDFVKLIRKAKNQAAEKSMGHGAIAANDDFISFDNDEADDECTGLRPLSVKDDGEFVEDLANRPHSKERYAPNDSMSQRQGVPSDHRSNRQLPRSELGPRHDVYRGSANAFGNHNRFDRDSYAREADLGNNRFDDRRPQHSARSSKRRHEEAGWDIVEEWIAVPGSDSIPWVPSSHAYSHLKTNPEQWLHNEILDFYDFVAARKHEHNLRNELVARVNRALGPSRLPGGPGSILCFGSFPATLYLPTADMDLVYTSNSLQRGGPPLVDFSNRGVNKSILYKTTHKLMEKGLCEGRPNVIANARVPIIKFIDKVTLLQVDISFENLSGIAAQATFDKWKQEYPDMVYIVIMVKQFLAMRGLNEVHSGGIGGFAIICLVVSYLQHTPASKDLGECFIGFLDYYGNNFDLAKMRIQMNPPSIISKSSYGIDGREEKATGLSIQDPNRPDNNISGGSHRAWDVFRAFANGHATLQDRMSAARAGRNVGPSILEQILGGNYESYIRQRRLMEGIN